MSVSNVARPVEEHKWPSAEPLQSRTRVRTISDVVRLVETDARAARDYFDQIFASHQKLSVSDLFDVYLGRAKACFLLGALADLQSAENDLQEATNLLECLKDGSWKKAEISCRFALICIRKEDYKSALSHFQAGWTECKVHKELASEYIKFLQKYGDEQKLILEICNEVIHRGLDSPEFFFARAKIHFDDKQWLKAHHDCKSYLAAGNGDPSEVAEILKIGSESARTLRLYKEAAEYLEYSDSVSSAKAHVEQSVKLLETKLIMAPLILVSSGLLLFGRLQWDAIRMFPEEAFAIFDALPDLLKKTADLFVALLCRAAACIEGKNLERFQSARMNLECALQLLTKNEEEKRAMVLQLLGRLCIREKKIDAAQKYFTEGLKISKKLLIDGMALLPDDQNEWEQALMLCKIGLIFSKDPTIYSARAKIYSFLNMWEEARIDCDCFLAECSSETAAQIEILDLAAKSCLKLKKIDYESAYDYMLKAYKLDSSKDLIRRFKQLNDIFNMEEFSGNQSPPSFHLILDAAEKMDDSEEALEIYDYILERPHEILNDLDLAAAHIGRAKACAESKVLERFPSARKNLEEALKLILDSNASNLEKDLMKAEIFCCYACLCIEEKESGEALYYFQEGWALAKIHSLRLAYSKFWAGLNQLQEAMKICREGNLDDIDAVWCSTYVYRDVENGAQAIKLYDALLHPGRLEIPKQLVVLNDAIQVAMKMKDWKKAEEYAYKVCKLDLSPKLILHMKTLLEVHRKNIGEMHLENLRQWAGGEISKLSLVLETFQNELSEHPKILLKLLEMRGNKYLKGEKVNKARRDFREIEDIFKKNVGALQQDEKKGS